MYSYSLPSLPAPLAAMPHLPAPAAGAGVLSAEFMARMDRAYVCLVRSAALLHASQELLHQTYDRLTRA
jgi:hypothetical protein